MKKKSRAVLMLLRYHELSSGDAKHWCNVTQKDIEIFPFSQEKYFWKNGVLLFRRRHAKFGTEKFPGYGQGGEHEIASGDVIRQKRKDQ